MVVLLNSLVKLFFRCDNECQINYVIFVYDKSHVFKIHYGIVSSTDKGNQDHITNKAISLNSIDIAGYEERTRVLNMIHKSIVSKYAYSVLQQVLNYHHKHLTTGINKYSTFFRILAG